MKLKKSKFRWEEFEEKVRGEGEEEERERKIAYCFWTIRVRMVHSKRSKNLRNDPSYKRSYGFMSVEW